MSLHDYSQSDLAKDMSRSADIHALYVFKGRSKRATVAYRAVFLLFSVTSLIRETDYFLGKQRLGAMFAFLTQLSAILTCILLIVGIIQAVGVNLENPKSKLSAVYGVLFSVCASVETQVTVVYWAYLSWSWHIPKVVNTCENRLICHYFNVMVHGFPSFVTWFMLLTEPTFIPKSDYLWMLGYIGVFFAIHIPYTLLNKPLYPFVDFRTIWGYLAILVVVLFSTGSFLLVKWASDKVRKSRGYNLAEQMES